jgi:hypothetical protein
MKRKGPAKLFLHRETLRRLEGSELRAIAGATAQLGCDNTLNNSCKGTCDSCLPCPTIVCTFRCTTETTTNTL